VSGGPALDAFSYDWIGGDISGLAAFATKLQSYVPKIGDVVTALDKQVATIVSAGGWQGQAASAFTKAWQVDAVGATALGVVISSTAKVCGQLASNLATIENALEGAAAQVEAHGVLIGPGGEPAPEPLTASAESWRQAYISFRNECLSDAMQARNNAATALTTVYGQIAPPPAAGGGSGSLTLGDGNTLGDYLRAFWALPTEYRKQVAESVEEQEGLVTKAAKALASDRDALGRFVKGNQIQAHLSDLGGAQTKLAGLEADLKTAQAGETNVTKALDFSVRDIPAFSGDDLSGLLKASAEIPFVDIGSAGLGTYLSYEQDTADGVNPVVAAVGETGGTAASFAAAGGAAADVGGSLGVSLGVSGVVAWGVGDYIHNLIDQPWGADLNHQDYLDVGGYPVSFPDPLTGAVNGFSNATQQTGMDAVNMLKDAGSGIVHNVEGWPSDVNNYINQWKTDLNPLSW
jgi:uncharacterized protein YukE